MTVRSARALEKIVALSINTSAARHAQLRRQVAMVTSGGQVAMVTSRGASELPCW